MKPKTGKYYLYYPDDDLEEFEEEKKIIDRIDWLVEFSAVSLDDMRVIVGKEYQIKQNISFELED